MAIPPPAFDSSPNAFVGQLVRRAWTQLGLWLALEALNCVLCPCEKHRRRAAELAHAAMQLRAWALGERAPSEPVVVGADSAGTRDR